LIFAKLLLSWQSSSLKTRVMLGERSRR
jgi:hypothetical protein